MLAKWPFQVGSGNRLACLPIALSFEKAFDSFGDENGHGCGREADVWEVEVPRGVAVVAKFRGSK